MMDSHILVHGKDSQVMCLEVNENKEIKSNASNIYEIRIPTDEEIMLKKGSPFYYYHT